MTFELVETDLTPFLAEGGKISTDVELMRYVMARESLQSRIEDLKESAKTFAQHFKEEVAKAESALAFIEGPMLGYIETVGKRSLPIGTVYSTTRQSFDVVDEEAFLAWAKENDCIRTKVEPDKKTAIALWKDGVAVPQGVEVKQTVSLSVRKK